VPGRATFPRVRTGTLGHHDAMPVPARFRTGQLPPVPVIPARSLTGEPRRWR